MFSEFGNSQTSWDPESADRLRVKTWLTNWYHVPIIIWNRSRSVLDHLDNANLYLGPTERRFVQNSQGWLSRYADFNLTLVTPPKVAAGCYGQTNSQNLLLLYCVNRTHTLSVMPIPITDWLAAAQMPNLTAKKWQVSWFYPATGQLITTALVTQPYPTTPAFTTDIVSEWRALN